MLKDYWKLFKESIGEIIEFEFAFRIITLLAIHPLFYFMFNLTKRLLGFNYVSNDVLISMAKSPLTSFVLFIGIIIFTIFQTAEFSALVTIGMNNSGYKKLPVRVLLKSIYRDVKRTLEPKNYHVIGFMVLTVLGTGYMSTIINPLTIPEFISNEIANNLAYSLIYISIMLIIIATVLTKVFTVIIFYHEDCSWKIAKKRTNAIFKRKKAKSMLLLVANIVFFEIIGYAIITIIELIPLKLLPLAESKIIISLSISFIKIVSELMPFISTVFKVSATMLLAQTLYMRFAKEKNLDEQVNRSKLIETDMRKSFFKGNLKYIALGSFIIFALTIINSNLEFNMLSNDFMRSFSITAHRAGGFVAPENSLSGIDYAIEAGADYAEIDVQLTKDNIPILLHDKTFLRTAGVNKRPSNMTFDEISKLNANLGFEQNYGFEKVASLNEIIEKSANKIKLNIELKPYSNDYKKLADKVNELIIKYDFYDNCIVTSLHKPSLDYIKSINPDVKTGFILVTLSGDFTNIGSYDAFILEETFITKELVRQIHSMNKDVYAWTINNSQSYDRMIRLGVDNIISDEVSLGMVKRAIHESKPEHILKLEYILDRNLILTTK